MKKIALVTVLVGAAVFSSAQFLVDQGPSTGPYGGAWQDITGGQILADSFTLTQASTATGYNLFGVSTQAASYDLNLYADSGSNTPGSVLMTLSGISPASFTTWGSYGGNTVYEASFTGLNINLAAGTKYWISVGGNGSDAGVTSTNPSSNGDGYLAFTSGGSWVGTSGIGDLTYQLVGGGAVPEPMSMAALGLGVAALIRRRARK